ncbi:hypothetical protein [Candidatus Spongiihabitans sp.]|uniref:hypothetical protein n=1 Tax=Candidatus Spongiihabitans sp. TaxID=3101308 RepID=UPI003C7CBFB6
MPRGPGHKFRFNNPLYSLDATTIKLCLSAFPWADFRTTKGAVKLHVGLNHSGCLPEFAAITDGKTGDIAIGRTLRFPKGSLVAIDLTCFKRTSRARLPVSYVSEPEQTFVIPSLSGLTR